MIQIGLTTWSEHPTLMNGKQPTLNEYASKLPVVEIDTSFYGIPRRATCEKWVEETPPNFRFIIKAHQTMTLHRKWNDFFESEKELYRTYFDAIQPLVEANKLEAILFQFPPIFDCQRDNILYLRRIRNTFSGYPVAIEFRNATWYEPKRIAETIAFMRLHEFILVIVDEPQVTNQSVPLYATVTNDDAAIFRLHGRNREGWKAKGEDWRKLRTLYRYNPEELQELQGKVVDVSQQVKKTSVIFNNNSGGDAADNARTLKELLHIDYTGLNPEQMDLF